MVSRSHLDAATQRYLDRLPHARRIACGSSIKFCRLAEGLADHYPRLGPTHDWDVAAGHAILAAAGGSVVGRNGEALAYGTPELRIPAFLACGRSAAAVKASRTKCAQDFRPFSLRRAGEALWICGECLEPMAVVK